MDQGFSNAIQFRFNFLDPPTKLKIKFKKLNSSKENWIPIFIKMFNFSRKNIKIHFEKKCKNWFPPKKTGSQFWKKKSIWMDFLGACSQYISKHPCPFSPYSISDINCYTVLSTRAKEIHPNWFSFGDWDPVFFRGNRFLDILFQFYCKLLFLKTVYFWEVGIQFSLGEFSLLNFIFNFVKGSQKLNKNWSAFEKHWSNLQFWEPKN